MDRNRRKWSFEKPVGFIRQVHNNLAAQAERTVNISLTFRKTKNFSQLDILA